MNKAERRSAAPTFGQTLPVWAQIGVLSFGGPAGQIALMHRILVEERRWIGEERFLHALNFCMLLPGPEAMQLATYIGWTLHGTLGGLAAGLLFVLPGALVVLALSLAYAIFGDVPLVEAAFVGIKAAVLVIVIEALLRVAKRALRRPLDWGIAAAAFVALFYFDLPFPLVIIAAAAIGYGFAEKRENASLALAAANSVKVSPAQTFRTALIWLSIWIGPLLLLAAIFGRTHVLTDAAIFFSKLAVVTFGGAYSVLAYMAQQAVATYGWLTPGEMLDGLGLAETTPGPLILVTEFVGFLVGYREGGEPRLLFGLLGAAVALWATFAPCFLWIFVGAPYIDRLGGSARLRGSLAAVTAAVVGVILNLSLWFGLHVLFAKVDAVWYGPFRLWLPELTSLDTKALLLGALSAVLLLKVKLGIGGTLAAAAASALAWHLIGG